jgi:hypothetical protein
VQALRRVRYEPQQIKLFRIQGISQAIAQMINHTMILTDEIEYNLADAAKCATVPAIHPYPGAWIGLLLLGSGGSQTW